MVLVTAAIDPDGQVLPGPTPDAIVTADTLAAAAEANVQLVPLLGAMSSTALTARQYLIAVGELSAPVSAPALPVNGPLGQRLLCIEGHESGHNGSAVNRTSGARGWLQWLPSTARAWGVVIGDRHSEWVAAARIAAQGERFFRSQWVPLQRGLC